MTTREWWQARLIETRALGQQFDVTKTWTDTQRLEETGRIWVAIRSYFSDAKRAVDFGCGPGRFQSYFHGGEIEYTGVDVLEDFLPGIVKEGGRFWLYDEVSRIPEDLDGDAAFYCLIIQHLDDERAILALKATRAKRIVMVEGAWRDDAYSKARPPSALSALLAEVGCTEINCVGLETPLAKYKIVVGDGRTLG